MDTITFIPDNGEEREITLTDVLRWIIDNADDEEAMVKINKMTFPFTPNYRPRRDE